MKSRKFRLSMFLAVSMFCSLVAAQQSATTSSATVPRLVNFSGKTTDPQGKAISGIAGVTFAIYKDQYEGAPLWMETQNIQADAKGNYTVQLGASKSEGLPLELFSSGEARWLGVRVNAGEEQPRVLLLSVPYALKAADAETVGGLPASAFVLAAPPTSMTSTATPAAATPQPLATGTTPVTTTGGTVNKLAKFDASADVTNSQVFDNGTNVGIGNSAPAAKLDVSGTGIFRGALSLPATGAANATAGKNSQPFNFTASSFNSGTLKAVNETFRWQAEPVGNNSTTPLGKLNLLFGSGTATPAETGLSISNKGAITFVPGQTFPSTVGTVKSVGLSAPSSDFTVSGSPVTSSGTLGLNWNVAPTSASTANAIVKRDGTGNFSANNIDVNTIFAFNPTSVAVVGQTNGNFNFDSGVFGQAEASNGNTIGVWGTSNSSTGLGVVGVIQSTLGTVGASFLGTTPVGVLGDSNGIGVVATSDNGQALVAENSSPSDTVVISNRGTGAPLFVAGTGGSVFVDGKGNLTASGAINGSSKNFRIDHPLDPADKYLYHASVESSEMMNIYTGNAVLDASGGAAVQLPNWFEAVNAAFRYQLTAVGAPGPNLYVAQEISNHHFMIAGGQPGMKVSWLVTGVRQDAYAKAHPLVVEQAKPASERGSYIHPELFGAPEEKAIAFAHMKQKPEARVGQVGHPKP